MPARRPGTAAGRRRHGRLRAGAAAVRAAGGRQVAGGAAFLALDRVAHVVAARWVLLRSAPEIVTLTVLAVTGGTLVSVVVEEVRPEAHEGETSRAGVMLLVGGFALSAYPGA